MRSFLQMGYERSGETGVSGLVDLPARCALSGHNLWRRTTRTAQPNRL